MLDRGEIRSLQLGRQSKDVHEVFYSSLPFRISVARAYTRSCCLGARVRVWTWNMLRPSMAAQHWVFVFVCKHHILSHVDLQAVPNRSPKNLLVAAALGGRTRALNG